MIGALAGERSESGNPPRSVTGGAQHPGAAAVITELAFVAQPRRAMETAAASRPGPLPRDAMVVRICVTVGIAHLWLTVLGQPGQPLAPVLGVRLQNVYRAAAGECLLAAC